MTGARLARLRMARERVARTRDLLGRPSLAHIESGLLLLGEARDLASGPAPADAAERAAAAELHAALAGAVWLAREAAALYLECVRLGGAGSRDYAPRGAAAQAPPRLLAEA